MIDLHAHVLPGIDDGSADLDTSLAMLDAAAAIGFHTVLSTPHLVGPLTAGYRQAVDVAFRQIAPQALARTMRLIPGFESRLLPDIPDRLARGEAITLGASRTVLLDLPSVPWPPYADATLFAIQTAGFLPLLAHPERYPDVQADPGRAVDLARRGVALQVTIGAFSGMFGRRVQRTAEALLALGVVHVAATDAHSAGQRMAAVGPGLARLDALVGREGRMRLTLDNPMALLNGVMPAPVGSARQRGPGG